MRRWISDFVARALITGPDPRAPDDPQGLITLPPFKWWQRLLVVVTAAIVGGIWADTGVGRQLAWGLDYGGLIAVSLAASYWIPILLVNLGLVLLWVFLPLPSPTDRPLWMLRQVVLFLNRQVGHLEAFAVWVTVAVITYPKLSVQLPFLAGVVLLGPPIINGLARARLAPGAKKSTGDVHRARRPIIYGVTALGLVALAAQAPRQVWKLAPVILAIALGGLIPRLLNHMATGRRMKDDRVREARMGSLRAQLGGLARLDHLIAAAVTVAMIATVVYAWNLRRVYDDNLRAASGGGHERADVCMAEPGGPTAPEVSLFIVSDSQFHELQGKRFPGQAELADAFVPVALRPVELDLLEPATLWRFRSVYADLVAQAAKEHRTVLWAHLGDFTDLACAGEMTRAARVLEHFAALGPLAGFAPGNHDKSFTGNFFWSPFWDSACAQRLEKVDSDRSIDSLASKHLVAGARMMPAQGNWLKRLGGLTGRGSALATVSPLGEVTHLGKRRGLVGVFIDTADEIDFDFGVAGLFGTFSRAQAELIVRAVGDLQREKGAPYDDPLYLLFGHHPFDATTPEGHGHIAELIARLDGAADPTASVLLDEDSEAEEWTRDQPPRVLALITAHTHHAQSSFHCVRNRRYLRELVVGSTIDPPQEASLLTVGPDPDGRASVRLRTLPAVGREEKTCGHEALTTSAQCRVAVGELQAHADCKPLFEDEDAQLGGDCQVLERPMTLQQRLEAIARSRGPTTPFRIKQAQRVRARRLFSCLCRGGLCEPPQAAVDLTDDAAATDFLVGLAKDGTTARPATAGRAAIPARPAEAWEKELTCLSWAASALQAHKAGGMEMADALRCAFDDGTLTAAKDYVAVLRPQECR